MLYSFAVTGMTCGHCERAVIQALEQVDPQAQVTVDRAQNHVQVESSASRDALVSAIESEGYCVSDQS